MEKILEQISHEVKGLKVGQDRLESRVGNIEKGQERLERRMDSLEEGQKQLETRMDTLETRMGHLDDNQKRLETKIDQVDQKVDHLNISIKKDLAAYFQNIEKPIDCTTEKICNTLKQQQATIDVLSARSIAHEADIKTLNQILRNQ